jgi:NTE family protein
VRDRGPGGAVRVALVLGSGGLAGTAFHAGLLSALAERGWDARDAAVVVGTSAGSTTAALLRAGFPPRDLLPRMTGEPMSADGERLLGGVPPVQGARRQGRPRLFPVSPALLRHSLVRRPGSVPPGVLLAAALPAGTAPTDEISAVYDPLHPTWPERPLWICALRLDTGARVVFGRDRTDVPVGTAVIASCAIPGLYVPPVVDGVQHVDGGAWSLCNADLVADADVDLAVISAPMSTTARLTRSSRGLARLQLAREVRALRRAGTPVLVVAPDEPTRALMAGTGMDAARRPAIARHVHDTVLAGVDRQLLERLTA